MFTGGNARSVSFDPRRPAFCAKWPDNGQGRNLLPIPCRGIRYHPTAVLSRYPFRRGLGRGGLCISKIGPKYVNCVLFTGVIHGFPAPDAVKRRVAPEHPTGRSQFRMLAVIHLRHCTSSRNLRCNYHGRGGRRRSRWSCLHATLLKDEPPVLNLAVVNAAPEARRDVRPPPP